MNQKSSGEVKQKFPLFRAVFWGVMPCKMIVDRRFRGTCCLHHTAVQPRRQL
jgi:hypothetical protein